MPQIRFAYFAFFIFSTLFVHAQKLKLPTLSPQKNDSNYYFISTCEAYHQLFETKYYQRIATDSCPINFNKYDLIGHRNGDSVHWQLQKPKKSQFLKHTVCNAFDTIDWFRLPQTLFVSDTLQYANLKNHTKNRLPNLLSQKEMVLMYNHLWYNSSGYCYFILEYDSVQNHIVCNLINVYGGGRGMRSKDSWILFKKPNQSTTYEVREIEVF